MAWLLPSLSWRARACVPLVVAGVALSACATDASPPVASNGALLARSQTALSAMSPASRDVVARARVPFLLLPRPWAASAIATSGPRWSALSARDGELTLSLHGTDAIHHTLDPHETRRAQPRQHVRGVPAHVTENEGIRSVSWTENGVAWALEVECFRHDSDPRCTGDAFVLDVAERLEIAAPSPSADPTATPVAPTNGGAR